VRGRLVWALEGSDRGVVVWLGDALGAAAVVVVPMVFGSVTSVVVGMRAALPVVGVEWATATGGGV
jgi:hypothetical protein